jgi:hypothetical protein
MAGSRRALTPDVEQQILNFIGAGGFPHVAAEAAGVPKSLFDNWIERGARPGSREPYRSFAQRVSQTAARARLKAEIEAREKDPRFWLMHGPARESADSPGWSSQVKPLSDTQSGGAAAPMLAEVNQVWRKILEKLERFPDARVAVIEALQGTGR